MRARFILAGLLAPALAAQILVEPDAPAGRRMEAAFAGQWSRPDAAKLRCLIRPFQPFLDYGLRVWAGYSAELPADQFASAAPDSAVAAVTRVTPRKPPGAPVHLYQRLALPPRPAGVDLRKVEFSLGGGFFLGQGEYRIELLLISTGGGACRGSWSAKVRQQGVSQSPGSVRALESSLWHGFTPGAGNGRAAVFLHAAPVRPRRYVTRLSPWDRQVLLSTLSTVLRDGGFSSASLVVFDLNRRDVLFREESIGSASVRRLARQLAQIDLGTISMRTLAEAPPPREFLEETVRRELAGGRRPDALVFIGTRWRAGPKLDRISPDLREAAPQAYFIGFSTPRTAMDADSVSSLVRGMKGKVFPIFLPPDLAEAVREIRAAR